MRNKIKNFFSFKKNDERSSLFTKRTKYLLIIALISLLLLIVSNIFSSKKEDPPQEAKITLPSEEKANQSLEEKGNTTTSEIAVLEKNYEKHLEQMLNKIKGVSEAEVMVNLDSTDVNIYEKNLITGEQSTDELDQNGGTRKVEDYTEETQTVLVRQGDQEVPLRVQTKKPEVRGVFVVAKGVDHATVQMWVTESISKVLDVSTHKISVMPKN